MIKGTASFFAVPNFMQRKSCTKTVLTAWAVDLYSTAFVSIATHDFSMFFFRFIHPLLIFDRG